jgi:hypothetical protein
MHDAAISTPPTLHATAPDPERSAADALRYWERRRLGYNAVLVLVVASVFATNWSRLQQQASIDFVLGLFLLAVLANIAFCAAYPADLFVQRAGPGAWRQRARTVLFAVGTSFAAVLAQFIARGMVAGG